MNSLKQFIDRISVVERNGAHNVIIPLNEAKMIRDELTKLLLSNVNSKSQEIIQVEITGGKW